MSAPAANSAPFSPFRPDTRGPGNAADSVLSQIAAAQKSLAQIAADHGTSLPALALWLESPEAQARMGELSAGLAAATRLAALAHTHSAVTALDDLLTDYRSERAARTPPATSSAAPGPAAVNAAINPTADLRERLLAERRRGNIIRAATTILRLTRLPSFAPPSRTPASRALSSPHSAGSPAPQHTRPPAPAPTVHQTAAASAPRPAHSSSFAAARSAAQSAPSHPPHPPHPPHRAITTNHNAPGRTGKLGISADSPFLAPAFLEPRGKSPFAKVGSLLASAGAAGPAP